MKEKIKEPVTVLGLAREGMTKAQQEALRRDQVDAETIVKLQADNRTIDQELLPLEETLAAGNREYRELRAEQEKKIQARIAEDSAKIEDVKSGKVTIRAWTESDRTAKAIAQDARLQAAKELEAPRLALKEVRKRVLELREQRAKNTERIEVLRADEAINFHHSLGAIQKELEMAGAYSLAPAAAHQEWKRAQTENLIVKGLPGLTKTWICKTIEEVEYLETDPAIDERDLESFRKIVEQIKASNFQKQVTLSYSRQAMLDKPAGSFWYVAL